VKSLRGSFREQFGSLGFYLAGFFRFMANAINIVDAIRSPRLFGCLPGFKSLDTWTAWLVVLKAIFGLPMTADDLAIFQRHTGRVSPPLGGSKETYLIIGRRGRKSFISALGNRFADGPQRFDHYPESLCSIPQH